MAYTIYRTNGTIFAVIPDGEINANSTVTLIGQNTTDYGQLIDENFVYLLENSANNTAPVSPVTGQLWFDTTNSTMKMWNGGTWVLPPASTAVTVTASAQPLITSVGTLTNLNLSGPLVGTSLSAATIGNAGAAIIGNVMTAAQPHITSLGTLSSLSVTGNVTAGNVNANITGTVTNALFSNIANLAYSVAGANVTGTVPAATIAGSANIANTAYAVSGANVSGSVGQANLANIASVAYSVSGANVSGTVSSATTATTATSAVTATSATTAGTVTANAQANITSVGTLTSLTVSGNLRTDNYQYANGTPVTFGSGTVPSGNVTYAAPYIGATTITGNSKWSQFVSVLDFGADPTGSADSRGAFQAALNTAKHVYIPTGNYKINDRLIMLYSGQTMSGDGRNASVLQIGSGFNLSANAVIDCSGFEPGVELRDFSIVFSQPDTSNRASLTAYPVAIKAVGSPRTTIQNLKIQGAINGIDMTGNSGGTFIELLEMSAFGTGISINGSLDTVRINKFHFWPFGLTTNQQSIFYSNPTRALSVGRVDNLMLNEFLNISNLGLYMYDPGSWINIENSGFDTYNGVQQLDGKLQVNNSYVSCTTATAGLFAIKQQGGWAHYTNMRFICGSPNGVPVQMLNTITGSLILDQCHFEGPVTNNPYINMASNCLAGTSLQVANSTFEIGANTTAFVFNGATPSSGTFNTHFVNNIVQTNANVGYLNPMFKFTNNYRIFMTGNRAYDKGTGVGTFITIPQDNWNWVSGNMAPGWTMTFPTATSGYYSNNPR